MANEAILVQILADARLAQVTVLDNAGIEKGTIMKFNTDPNIAAASSADGDKFAGILAEEKVANDGQTEVAVWTHNAVFALKVGASSTVVLGLHVSINGANLIGDADVTTLTDFGEIVGKSMETGSNSEVIQVRLGM